LNFEVTKNISSYHKCIINYKIKRFFNKIRKSIPKLIDYVDDVK